MKQFRVKVILRPVLHAPLFEHPAGVSPRTAVLDVRLRPPGCGRRFDPVAPGVAERVRTYAPSCLAASLPVLTALAAEGIRPEHSVVVFMGEGERLSAADRDQLWDLFEVPVFEQIRDARGRLLASECEAHEGLHIVAARPGAEPERCACGAWTPLLDGVFALTRPCVVENAPKALAARAGV